MFVICPEEIEPPGTIVEEVAKASIKYPVREDVDPQTRRWIHEAFARIRIRVWEVHKQKQLNRFKRFDRKFKQHYGESHTSKIHKRCLRSPLWMEIRNRVMIRDRGCCFKCGGKATEVHHRSYGHLVMAGLDDSKLVALCRGCHQIVEFQEDGSRNSMAEKDAVLMIKSDCQDFPEPPIELRWTGPKHPPGWDRMNALQREGWMRRVEWLINEWNHIKYGIASSVNTLHQ